MGKTTFLDGLGESITRKTRDLSKKAGQIYESQKLQSRISGEERMIEKLKEDIGNLIYSRRNEGTEYDGELAALCEEIDQHVAAIAAYKKSAASIRGCKICPACKRTVEKDALFCPYCGTACPDPEPEVYTGDVEDSPVEAEEGQDEAGECEEAPETGADEPQTDDGTEGGTDAVGECPEDAQE